MDILKAVSETALITLKARVLEAEKGKKCQANFSYPDKDHI